jgi:hypothetical protein
VPGFAKEWIKVLLPAGVSSLSLLAKFQASLNLSHKKSLTRYANQTLIILRPHLDFLLHFISADKLLVQHGSALKQKTPTHCVEVFSLAPSPGLEPGTHGLTVRCSNQLSYEGVLLFAKASANLSESNNLKTLF